MTLVTITILGTLPVYPESCVIYIDLDDLPRIQFSVGDESPKAFLLFNTSK